ncbi:hypothetical protein HDF22_001297 [Mucilaginibacter lappiensis]|uniref:Uncharacterized protein n=1 Tax=Mucilaginibacter lappiensis TaxID=354630 RepID=A0A841JGM7_9SPHI|nr:hypothetical protein [Mucilaginibacter lappiensis]
MHVVFRLPQTKSAFHFHEKRLGWITVQNPHHFVDELIEIGGFSEIVKNQE